MKNKEIKEIDEICNLILQSLRNDEYTLKHQIEMIKKRVKILVLNKKNNENN